MFISWKETIMRSEIRFSLSVLMQSIWSASLRKDQENNEVMFERKENRRSNKMCFSREELFEDRRQRTWRFIGVLFNAKEFQMLSCSSCFGVSSNGDQTEDSISQSYRVQSTHSLNIFTLFNSVHLSYSLVW